MRGKYVECLTVVFVESLLTAFAVIDADSAFQTLNLELAKRLAAKVVQAVFAGNRAQFFTFQTIILGLTVNAVKTP